LDLLYELYADERQQEPKVSLPKIDQSEDVFDLPNVPNLPVVIVDEKEVRWF
jgi:hypothetical protein